MRKSTRIVKRLLALFLVVLMSINSFGAVVSDNDGSAFITKAEFDSLKNDFQSQIDQYNTSMDSKIDGAIASYLAGIKVSDMPDNYFATINRMYGHNQLFLNSAKIGSSALTTALNTNMTKVYSAQYKMPGKIYTGVVYYYNSASSSRNVYVELKQSASTRATQTVQVAGKACTSVNVTWVGSSSLTNGSSVTVVEDGQTKASSGATISLNYDQVIKAQVISPSGAIADVKTMTGAGTSPTITLKHNAVVTGNKSRTGTGSQWTYTMLNNGNKALRKYWTTYNLKQSLDLYFKSYRNFTSTLNTISANTLQDNTTCTYTPSNAAEWGVTTYGTKYLAWSSTNGVGFLQQIIEMNKSTTDQMDYAMCQWGKGTDQLIYASNDEEPMISLGSNLSSSYVELGATTTEIQGANQSISKVSNTVKEVYIVPEGIKLNQFVNTYLTNIAGEPVYLGYGVPILATKQDDGEYRITIKAKLTEAPAGAAVTGGTVTIRLAKNHFTNGNFTNAADRLYEGTIICGSDGLGEVTFEINGVEKTLLWLNLFGDADQRIVELTDVTVNVL